RGERIVEGPIDQYAARDTPGIASLFLTDCVQTVTEPLRAGNCFCKGDARRWIPGGRICLPAERVPSVGVASSSPESAFAMGGNDQGRSTGSNRLSCLGVSHGVVAARETDLLAPQEWGKNRRILFQPFCAFPRIPVVVTECPIVVRIAAGAQTDRDAPSADMVDRMDLDSQYRREPEW